MVWKDAESIFQRRCHERRLCLIIRSLLWAAQEREVGSKGWWEGATSRSTFSPYIAWCVECSGAAHIMKPTGNELDLVTASTEKKKQRQCLSCCCNSIIWLPRFKWRWCYVISANGWSVRSFTTYSNLTNICLLFEVFDQECHFPVTTAGNFVFLIVFFFLHLLLAEQCLDMS